MPKSKTNITHNSMALISTAFLPCQVLTRRDQLNAKKGATGDSAKPKSEVGTAAKKTKRGGGPKAKAKAKGKAKASAKKGAKARSRKTPTWEEGEGDAEAEEVDSENVAPAAAKRTPPTKRKLPETEPEGEEPEEEEAEEDPSIEEEEIMKKPAARKPKGAKKETDGGDVAEVPAKGRPRATKSKPAAKRAKAAPKASSKGGPKAKAKSQATRRKRQSRDVEDHDLETDTGDLVDGRMKGIFLQVLKEVAKMPYDDMKEHLMSKKVEMENKVCRLNIYWTKCVAAVSLLTEENTFDVVGFAFRTGSWNTRMCAAYMCAWLAVAWMMFI